MESYHNYKSKHPYSYHHKFHKHKPRHHRYRYEEEQNQLYHIYQRHYYRKNNKGNVEYGYNKVPTIRASSPVDYQPIQKPVLPPAVQKPLECSWKLMAYPFLDQVAKDPQINNCYVGQYPEVEVTLSNLDNNVDLMILTDLVVKYGKIKLIQIYYHPLTKKHLGLAKIIFHDAVSAKSCVQSLNKTYVNGKVVNVFLDPSATQCKIMFDEITKEKSKPQPEVHKIKLFNQEIQSVKSVKFNEELAVKIQTKEKLNPSSVFNYAKNYDNSTIFSTTNNLPSVQSYSNEYNSIEGNSEYNESHSYSYTGYSCNVPLVPSNHQWVVTSPVTVSTPLSEPNINFEAQSKLNLENKIDMLSGKDTSSVEPVLLSIVKNEPDHLLDNEDNTVDNDFDLNLSVQPVFNDYQSDLTEEKVNNKEEMLSSLSNPPSSFLSKDINSKCFEATADQLSITRKKEKSEVKSFLNCTVRNVISNAMHESLDGDMSLSNGDLLGKSSGRNTPPNVMSLSSWSSHGELIVENDNNAHDQYATLPNYSFCEYFNPPQCNNHNSQQCLSYSTSYPCNPQSSSENFYKSKLPYDDYKKKKLSAQLKKKLMIAVKNELIMKIKCDLMNKMKTTLAFNTLDQWFEEAERQSKKKKKKSPKKTNVQNNNRSNQKGMVSTSENNNKTIYDNKVTISNSNDKDSCGEFKWQDKLNKSITLEVEIRELTPAGNDTPLAIDDLSSFHEENKTKKRKIDDIGDTPVESKKCLINGEKTPTEENFDTELENHSYFLFKPVSNFEIKVNATNKCIINKLKIPRFSTLEIEQPLEDSEKIKNVDQLTVQKQCSNQVKTKDFNRQSMVKKTSVIYEFLTKGIDKEDINYLKQSYESMISINDERYYWLNKTHWASHPVTDIPNEVPQNNEEDEWTIHDTGCARTEGYYKLDSTQKASHKFHFGRTVSKINPTKKLEHIKQSTGKILVLSREARKYKRQLSTPFGTEFSSKLNALKFRKRQLKFGKSAIHDWGLFAVENIAADEMIIEYVGQMIRPIIADIRERKYEATGIHSSYLFKIDLDTIVDATKCGNISRFINHSCNANCDARIIQIDGKKKIVIYSKQPIIANEEITYNYKFPLEEIKIPCLCGTHCCRGTLN